jgi:putative DNA-invertase from lambdoid prophage Rac
VVSRVFGYSRVSTGPQHTENQRLEIANAGFAVEPQRFISENVSGGSAIMQRKGFMRLLDKLEGGDVLVVSKLDRLGRNAVDIIQTVEKLEASGVRVYCLALGGQDLTSAAGKMVMGVIATFAQFERDMLIERTKAGLARAKAAGRVGGRRFLLSEDQRRKALAGLAEGLSVSALARTHKVSRQTIMRLRNAGDDAKAAA